MNGLQVTHRLTVLWPLAHPHAYAHTHMLSHTCICTFVPGEKRIWFSFISPRAVGSQRSCFIHLLFPFQPSALPPLFWCLFCTCCPIVHVFSPGTQALLCVLVTSSLPGLLIDRHTEPWVGMTLSKQQHHVSGRGLVTENTLCKLAASGCQVRNVTQVLLKTVLDIPTSCKAVCLFGWLVVGVFSSVECLFY